MICTEGLFPRLRLGMTEIPGAMTEIVGSAALCVMLNALLSHIKMYFFVMLSVGETSL